MVLHLDPGGDGRFNTEGIKEGKKEIKVNCQSIPDSGLNLVGKCMYLCAFVLLLLCACVSLYWN